MIGGNHAVQPDQRCVTDGAGDVGIGRMMRHVNKLRG